MLLPSDFAVLVLRWYGRYMPYSIGGTVRDDYATNITCLTALVSVCKHQNRVAM